MSSNHNGSVSSARSSEAATAEVAPRSHRRTSNLSGFARTSRQPSITVTNFRNAVPGTSHAGDRTSVLGGFPDYVAGSQDESIGRPPTDIDSVTSYVLEDQLPHYRQLMDSYNDLYQYVHTGRQALLDEIAADERSYASVLHSIAHFPPTERHAVDMVLAHSREKINEKVSRVEFFDTEIGPTRDRIKHELEYGLHRLPSELLMQCAQECQWPTVSVCQDLALPYDYHLMARGQYLPIIRPTPMEVAEDPEGSTSRTRIRELEAQIESLKRLMQTTRTEGGNNFALGAPVQRVTTVLEEVKPPVKKVDYTELRKRTQFPKFNNGTHSEAQEWLKEFEFLCHELK